MKQSDTDIISIHKYPLTFFSADSGMNLEMEDTKLQRLQQTSENFINLSINKKMQKQVFKMYLFEQGNSFVCRTYLEEEKIFSLFLF